MPSYEYRNGQMVEVPDVIVRESGELFEDINRTLVIEPDVEVTTHGRINATVTVRAGARLNATKSVSGTISVERDAVASFQGTANGTMNIRQGGTVILESGAVAIGTMQVDGTLINYGTRGTVIRGDGSVVDHPGSVVRPPDEVTEDGISIYRG